MQQGESRQSVFLFVLLAVAGVIVVGMLLYKPAPSQKTSQDLSSDQSSATSGVELAGQGEDMDETKELVIKDLLVGTGLEAVAGKTVSVHYEGRLTNGQKFDSSKDRKQPFSFKLGAGQVIQGWDQGVAGMKVGGKRKLVIPPSLGYGAQGAGNVIPPNATLVFEVELLKVE